MNNRPGCIPKIYETMVFNVFYQKSNNVFNKNGKFKPTSNEIWV